MLPDENFGNSGSERVHHAANILGIRTAGLLRAGESIIINCQEIP
jgi:hypothetical protein